MALLRWIRPIRGFSPAQHEAWLCWLLVTKRERPKAARSTTSFWLLSNQSLTIKLSSSGQVKWSNKGSDVVASQNGPDRVKDVSACWWRRGWGARSDTEDWGTGHPAGRTAPCHPPLSFHPRAPPRQSRLKGYFHIDVTRLKLRHVQLGAEGSSQITRHIVWRRHTAANKPLKITENRCRHIQKSVVCDHGLIQHSWHYWGFSMKTFPSMYWLWSSSIVGELHSGCMIRPVIVHVRLDSNIGCTLKQIVCTYT